MKVEEMKNSEVKDYLLEYLEIGTLLGKLTEKADELSKAATMRAALMVFDPTPAEVIRAEGILRGKMAEVILICEILACNTDAWDDVKDTQEEIARKWVELMMTDGDAPAQQEAEDRLNNGLGRVLKKLYKGGDGERIFKDY